VPPRTGYRHQDQLSQIQLTADDRSQRRERRERLFVKQTRINRNDKCNLQSVSDILLYIIYMKYLYVTLAYFISIILLYAYESITQHT